jgi:hypothetical protein
MSKRILDSTQCRWLAAAHYAGTGIILLVIILEDLPVSGIITATLLGVASLWLGRYWKGQAS